MTGLFGKLGAFTYITLVSRVFRSAYFVFYGIQMYEKGIHRLHIHTFTLQLYNSDTVLFTCN